MAALIHRCLLLILLLLPVTAFAGERINRIEIKGLKHSNARVIERELPFRQGDSWQEGYSEQSSRRLRNLGLFSSATVLAPDSDGVVRIFVDDRWPIWLLPEASRSDSGASSAGVALTHHNLWGLHHKLRLGARGDTGKNFSNYNGNSYQGLYHWRRVFGSNFGLDASFDRGRYIYDAYQNGSFSSSYVQEKQNWAGGISYGFGSVPGEGWDVRLGFSTNKTAYNLKSGPQLTDIRGVRRQAVHLSSSFRMIDDQVTWITGHAFDYNLNIAHKGVGSSINSYRQTLSLRRHIGVGRDNTVSYRINAGLATGEVLRDGLFDIGNREGMRGYFPGELQGDAYIYGTLEARYPLELNSNFQLVGFVDAGHVNRQGKRALGRSIVAGVGAGARWTLRWLVNGTLRVDGAYGVATHRWRLHLGTGQSF